VVAAAAEVAAPALPELDSKIMAAGDAGILRPKAGADSMKMLGKRFKACTRALDEFARASAPLIGGDALVQEIGVLRTELDVRFEQWAKWDKVPLPGGGVGLSQLDAVKKLWVLASDSKEHCDAFRSRVEELKRAVCGGGPQKKRRFGAAAAGGAPRVGAAPVAARKGGAGAGGGGGGRKRAARAARAPRAAPAVPASEPTVTQSRKRGREGGGGRGAKRPSVASASSSSASDTESSCASDGRKKCPFCKERCGYSSSESDAVCEREFKRRSK